MPALSTGTKTATHFFLPPTRAAYPRAQSHSGGATMQTTVRGFKHDDLERPETRSVVAGCGKIDLILECFQKRRHRATRAKARASGGAGDHGLRGSFASISPSLRPDVVTRLLQRDGKLTPLRITLQESDRCKR
jgi:hypothetical protein